MSLRVKKHDDRIRKYVRSNQMELIDVIDIHKSNEKINALHIILFL